jgi:hypothetical protein
VHAQCFPCYQLASSSLHHQPATNLITTKGFDLLGCDTGQPYWWIQMFWRNVLPLSSGWKQARYRWQAIRKVNERWQGDGSQSGQMQMQHRKCDKANNPFDIQKNSITGVKGCRGNLRVQNSCKKDATHSCEVKEGYIVSQPIRQQSQHTMM